MQHRHEQSRFDFDTVAGNVVAMQNLGAWPIYRVFEAREMQRLEAERLEKQRAEAAKKAKKR